MCLTLGSVCNFLAKEKKELCFVHTSVNRDSKVHERERSTHISACFLDGINPILVSLCDVETVFGDVDLSTDILVISEAVPQFSDGQGGGLGEDQDIIYVCKVTDIGAIQVIGEDERL